MPGRAYAVIEPVVDEPNRAVARPALRPDRDQGDLADWIASRDLGSRNRPASEEVFDVHA